MRWILAILCVIGWSAVVVLAMASHHRSVRTYRLDPSTCTVEMVR